jgi:hypothetical protein
LILRCTDGDVSISKAQIDIWIEAYPSVDVEAEIRRANCWMDANPRRRKTTRGGMRFMVNWLSRAQDSPRGRSRTVDRQKNNLDAASMFMGRK